MCLKKIGALSGLECSCPLAFNRVATIIHISMWLQLLTIPGGSELKFSLKSPERTDAIDKRTEDMQMQAVGEKINILKKLLKKTLSMFNFGLFVVTIEYLQAFCNDVSK